MKFYIDLFQLHFKINHLITFVIKKFNFIHLLIFIELKVQFFKEFQLNN